jgi:hypothetical protein
LVGLLEDPAPVVVREVVNALRSSGTGVPAGRLWPLLGSDHPRHVRHGAYRLLAFRDAWTRVKAGLTLVTDPDEVLRRRAHADLRFWRAFDWATTYHVPSHLMKEELESLITEAEPVLSSESVRELRWLLRTAA